MGVGRDGYVGEEGWMAKKAAERDMADVESGRSTDAHKRVTGAGVEDRGDVAGGNGAGRLDPPSGAGQSDTSSTAGKFDASQGIRRFDASNGAGRLDLPH